MHVKVFITLKAGVLDPQGKAIQLALSNLGFANIRDVRHSKAIELELDETCQDTAHQQVKAMCEKLLTNTVIEDYSIEISKN